MTLLALSGAPLIIVTIIAFVFMIGIIVSIHELGHYLVASSFDVLCYEYSIGFGPLIYKKKGKKTQFSVRAIPLGGYVSMAGEDILADDIKKEDTVGVNFNEEEEVSEIILDPKATAQVRGKCSDIDLNGINGEDLRITLTSDETGVNTYKVSETASYVFEKNSRLQIAKFDKTVDSKAWWKKILIYLAGPVMNFLLAIVILIIAFLSQGVANTESSKIGSISENMPAYGVLLEGDEIVSVNGNPVSSWTDFSDLSKAEYNDFNTEIVLGIKSGDELKTFTFETWSGINSIGITNYNAKNLKSSLVPTTTDVYGLELGNLGVRYITKPDNNFKYPLSSGDYLTKINVKSGTYEETFNASSWGSVCELFSTNDYIKTKGAEIRFEYYHKVSNTEYQLVPITETMQGVAQAYVDEVMNSQSVDVISHYIGVSATIKFDFFQSIGNAFKQFWHDFTLVFRTLKLLIAPSTVRQVGVQNLSSVVGIFSQLTSYVAAGFISVLLFMALISTNLGIVNLLPIPALDGGKILFAIIEAITKKRIPKKVEMIINIVSYLLLFGLLIFVTYNDILRLAI